ncbi:MAG: iron ABC transporter permease [Chloroflexi bacterium]|nr:iron ABC transporter permease [Chloroflexota bacterium]
MAMPVAARSAVVWSRTRISLSSVCAVGLLLFVAFLTLLPVAMVVYASFNAGSPMRPRGFTLDGYTAIFTSARNLEATWTSLWLAAVRTATSVGIATFLAWVVARTDTPLRRLLHFVVIVKFFMPPLAFIAGWMLLAAPKSGFINVTLQNFLPFVDGPVLDIFSAGGVIAVSTFASVPIWFMILLPAFTQMDASFEESSRMCGVGPIATFFRVTLPLIAPAVFAVVLLSLIHWLETFDTEIFLGAPAGLYVISTVVYEYVHQSTPAKYPPAMAFSTLLMVLTALLVFIYWLRVTSKQYRYTTVTGRGYAVRPIRLGRWKYVTLGLVLLYFFVSTLLPGFFVLIGPFMKYAGVFAGDWFTMDHWKLATTPQALASFKNSLLLGFFSATGGALLYTLVSYLALRTKYGWRGWLEFMTWLPFAMPGIVLALGLLWVYVGTIQLPFLVMYGTVQMLVLACIIKRMPTGVRTVNGVTIQISKELEEASRVHGASWLYTFTRIFIPLLWPGIVSVWLLTAVLSIKELVIILMLYSAPTMTLAVYFFQLATDRSQLSRALILSMLELGLIMLFWVAAKLLSRRGGGVAAGM